MVHLHRTTNYEEFIALMKILEESKQQTFVVFTGTPNESGESWCSDCVVADPVIKKQIEHNEEHLKDTNIVYAQVGKREEWKNNNENPFRLDKKIRLQFLPTLLKWGTLHKLQVEECLKPDLLNMVFNDTEDDS
ncbi:PREDICTED: thioredoxin domain-containing protein 17-like [Diuraphis noxia]|uniref:thioredoxin domain-containing protein 17-like n=1 Tax=Diuraphis noxia TaxID=143948 RepID=UPI000763861D|nr:PREDICTED: thioredoxin domain-containing protein 17-like [Diuraphis noxia]XP_015368407.1 PREDICTED: thioredoxin domain-containing protein 17-like [Diuraphis noxia]